MRNSFLSLLVIVLLGCGEKDDTSPNAIAPNTAAVRIDGVAFPVDVNRSEAIVNARTGELNIVLRASQPNENTVFVYVYNFRRKAERFANLPSQNPTSVDYMEAGANGKYYKAQTCNQVSRDIEIIQYNETNKTISGTFSGNMCFGTPNTASKTITGGQFNLPFRIEY